MTQDEIIEMARQADIRDSLEYDHMECDIKSLEAFANLVAQHEREACAEVCIAQMQGKSIWMEGARACSLAIRARGQA